MGRERAGPAGLAGWVPQSNLSPRRATPHRLLFSTIVFVVLPVLYPKGFLLDPRWMSDVSPPQAFSITRLLCYGVGLLERDDSHGPRAIPCEKTDSCSSPSRPHSFQQQWQWRGRLRARPSGACLSPTVPWRPSGPSSSRTLRPAPTATLYHDHHPTSRMFPSPVGRARPPSPMPRARSLRFRG